MKRSVEILQILRHGIDSILAGKESFEIRYTRIFNFEEQRVSLWMEVSDSIDTYTPVGRIDVLEIPTNNGRITCSCTLTEMRTGNTQRVILRLKNSEEREKECAKVFEFFRGILPTKEQINEHENIQGFTLKTRGAHSQNPKSID